MDAEAAGDFHDWELLPDSDASGVKDSSCLEGIEQDSEGIIRSDYFSIDSQTKYAAIQGDGTDDNSVESDNLSWIDPDTRYSTVKEKGEFWSSDGSDDGKYAEFEAKNQVDIVAGAKSRAVFDVIGADAMETSARFSSATGEIGSKSIDYENLMGFYDEGDVKLEPSCEEKVVDVQKETGEHGENADVVTKEATKLGGQDRNRGPPVWWKVPLDLLKYCLFRANPVWTLSVAAAMMGAIILGRRLYKMKQKSRSLQLKVTLDDKKVSQFMSRAARLNEAFSVVKRVPIIRPSLPAAGVAPWPMMSLR